MSAFLAPALIGGRAYLAPAAPPAGGVSAVTIDATKVPSSRTVVFGGSIRVVNFPGSKRIVSF